jgi:hypothetical protein
MLLSIMIGSLGMLPYAHAQNLLENAGIGSMQAGASGGLSHVGRALGRAQRGIGDAVAGDPRGTSVTVHRHAGRGRGHGHRRNTAGVVVVYPEGYDAGYETQPAPEADNGFAREPIAIQGVREQTLPPAYPPKMTEIPAKKGTSASKAAPPAIFVLKSGERIEAQRYLLTSNQVQLTANRQQRTIPLSMLNIDETMAANHKRGLDLQLPSESGIVSLGF